MENITLLDEHGKLIEAELLLTYFSEDYHKNYLIYLIDNELVASSYTKKEDKFLINNDLTEEEFDMLDKIIEKKLGDLDA